jgi:hypothetical protein
MLGFEPIQVSIAAEKTSDGNYKVKLQQEEIFSERVLDEKTFQRFREAVGAANPSIGAPELVGQHFKGPLSRRVLEDFGFAEFYRAA